jgi:hypothetical protein
VSNGCRQKKRENRQCLGRLLASIVRRQSYRYCDGIFRVLGSTTCHLEVSGKLRLSPMLALSSDSSVIICWFRDQNSGWPGAP